MEADSIDLTDCGWSGIAARLGGDAAIDGLARSTRALVRRREVRDGSQLLRLALHYASVGGSLRASAAWGEAALGVALSDVALMERLQEAGDFLAAVCAGLLREASGAEAPGPDWDGPPIRLVDGSMFAGPGPDGGQHRLHAAYDPVAGAFAGFEVTAVAAGESLSRAGIEPGAVAVADRNYAKTAAFRELAENGAFFAARAGIRSMRMIGQESAKRLTGNDVLAALGDGEEAEIAVGLVEAKPAKGQPRKAPLAARLVLLKAAPAAARREKARIARSRTRHGATPSPETESLAGVVMIVTNLPAAHWTPRRVAALYRLRWQIEIAFKTLKSTFRMRDVPAKDPDLARAWILANLATALLASNLARAIERAIPPSGSARNSSVRQAPPQAPRIRKTRRP